MKKITQTQKNCHDHWLLGGNPRAIEAQEARGQKELINASQLPKKINNPRGIEAKAAYEKMGILVYPFAKKIPRVFQEQVKKIDDDPLFIPVILPMGWKLEPTSHSMWSNLLDEQGRTRATIFYKAAFYDRSAFINLICRYQATTEFVTLDPGSKNYDQYAVIKDNATGERIYQSEPVNMHTEKGKQLREEAESYLKQNYPDHEDLIAYW